ncbi:MAG TPA: hypothetical protein VF950_11435 [Planctomycetota bacterium]
MIWLLLLCQAEVDKGDAAATTTASPDLTLRARVSKGPATPVAWRWGGEGLGGAVTQGVFGDAPLPMSAFGQKLPKTLFLTLTAKGAEEIEVECSLRGKPVKTIKERGPTAGLCLPDLIGISDYARGRAEALEKLPWAGRPVPKKYAVLSDLGGWGEGTGYGIRYSDRAIAEAEARALRQLGVNGLRSRPAFLKDFARASIDGHLGFPSKACPFAGGSEKQIAAALAERKDHESWILTVDEIGTIFAATPEGKLKHAAACAACGREYRAWVKAKGYAPADFGKASWEDVAPADLSAPADPLSMYATSAFGNVATARAFTPLRDALAGQAFTYALRGNTFLMGGSSLDFFEFYRHADNAFVYETSNRDPRVWGWDSYLCEVGRRVSAENKIAFGIYVKPHRGAPLQRMLAAAGRGARMIYWYTYGPDYWKGDSFSPRPEALALVSKAARLLGRAEDVLYGATYDRRPEVAVVNPWTSERWLGLDPTPARIAAWENAKWTYTALQHAHVPVDALDEELLIREDLSAYKVIYVSGPNLSRAAAAKLAAWNGLLVTSGGGLMYDEANQPLKLLPPRPEPVLTIKPALYGATALQSFGPGVTREPPAPTRTDRAVVISGFPGLEYSAAVRTDAYDMSKDFRDDLRALIAAPALERVKPDVAASHPLVEGLLVRNGARRAVVLMNWAYRAGGVLVPHANLTVFLRGVASAKVSSCALDRAIPAEAVEGGLRITLPVLEEGDVLELVE